MRLQQYLSIPRSSKTLPGGSVFMRSRYSSQTWEITLPQEKHLTGIKQFHL